MQNKETLHNNAGRGLMSIDENEKVPRRAKMRVEALYWRKRWDSNPRYREVQLISSQSRYDHFDTLPQIQHKYFTPFFGFCQVEMRVFYKFPRK